MIRKVGAIAEEVALLQPLGWGGLSPYPGPLGPLVSMVVAVMQAYMLTVYAALGWNLATYWRCIGRICMCSRSRWQTGRRVWTEVGGC